MKLRISIRKDGSTATNRCGICGEWVGERFGGYDNDRFTDRGRLWCERCLAGESRRKRKRGHDEE